MRDLLNIYVVWGFSLAIHAAAIAAASVTIARSRIFARPRALVSKLSPFLGEGISCHYCVSHWLASAVWVFDLMPSVNTNPFLDFVVMLFALVAGSTLVSGWMMRLLEGPSAEVVELRSRLQESRQLIRELIDGGAG